MKRRETTRTMFDPDSVSALVQQALVQQALTLRLEEPEDKEQEIRELLHAMRHVAEEELPPGWQGTKDEEDEFFAYQLGV